jgi:phosphatidylethanolamine-binding protein (PEBP) family uncharacterized protein
MQWSQVCHWLVTAKSGRVKELVEYKAPAPPEGTGRHRYVVVHGLRTQILGMLPGYLRITSH